MSGYSQYAADTVSATTGGAEGEFITSEGVLLFGQRYNLIIVLVILLILIWFFRPQLKNAWSRIVGDWDQAKADVKSW